MFQLFSYNSLLQWNILFLPNSNYLFANLFHLLNPLYIKKKFIVSQMLGTCPSLLYSKSQSSIRHKVRKLRAKVRTLIPEQGCQHHEKRNLKVERFMKRRPMQCHTSSQSRSCFKTENKKQVQHWIIGTGKFQQWFTQPESLLGKNKLKANNHRYQFHKLNQEEIEQINEDKIYYLGQNNIQPYNNFLKTYKSHFYKEKQNGLSSLNPSKMKCKQQKPHKMQNKIKNCFSKWEVNQNNLQISVQNSKVRQKTFFSFTMQSTPFNKTSDRQPYRKNSDISISKFNFHSAKNIRPQKSQYSNQQIGKSQLKSRGYQTFHNYKVLGQRKQEIEEEQKRIKLQRKARMDIQMAKAEANQRQIKSFQFQKMKAMQNIQKEKHEKAVKKMNILMKKGQIVQLDEELRDILIKRKNQKKHEKVDSCLSDSMRSPNHQNTQ